MTAYFCAVTVHCGHGWNKKAKQGNCSKTAYIECSRGMAEQLLQHKVEWFCQQHHGEQTNDLSDMNIEENSEE